MRALLELLHACRRKPALPNRLRALHRRPRRNRTRRVFQCGGHFTAAGLALLLGGATGNVTDRILHGAVTDFFEVWFGSFHYPAFNVADSAITIGAVLIIFDVLFTPKNGAPA